MWVIWVGVVCVSGCGLGGCDLCGWVWLVWVDVACVVGCGFYGFCGSGLIMGEVCNNGFVGLN